MILEYQLVKQIRQVCQFLILLFYHLLTLALQIVAAARKNNVPVWYVIAKDEGHGFVKKVNRDFYLNSLLYFLELHLLNR
jgi:hypothetical protein